MRSSYKVKPTDDELLLAIGNDDAKAAASAATVLGLRGDERAYEALMGLLEHPEPDARAAAASALGLLGRDTAVPALRNACEDPDSSVASAASLALQRLGVEGCAEQACANLIGELGVDDAERRALAARALGGLMNPAALEPLIGTLSDPNAQVRADAAASLGWIGEASAVPHLMSVGFADPDQHVRQVAMHAVARLIVPETPL